MAKFGGLQIEQDNLEEIPSGRFGRSLQQTRFLQERAVALRNQRLQAEEEARRAEEERKKQQEIIDVENERRSRLQRVLERVSRGKSVGGEFKQLSPEERTLVTQQAREAGKREDYRRKISARQAVSSAEQSASQSLIPEVREQIYRQAFEEPKRSVFEIITSPVQIKQSSSPEQIYSKEFTSNLPKGISVGTGKRGGILITTGEFGQTRETLLKINRNLSSQNKRGIITQKIDQEYAKEFKRQIGERGKIIIDYAESKVQKVKKIIPEIKETLKERVVKPIEEKIFGIEAVREKDLSKERNIDIKNLNKDIDKFNKGYGNRTLSESEFQKAELELQIINQKSSEIEIKESALAKIEERRKAKNKPKLVSALEFKYLPKFNKKGKFEIQSIEEVSDELLGLPKKVGEKVTTGLERLGYFSEDYIIKEGGGGFVFPGAKKIGKYLEIATSLGAFIAFPGVSTTLLLTSGYPKFADPTKSFEKRFEGALEVGSAAAFIGISAISKARTFLKEPVQLKVDPKVKANLKSETEIINIFSGEDVKNIGKVTITAEKPSRSAFFITRGELIKARLPLFAPKIPSRTALSKKDFEELQQLFPKGKIIEVEPEVKVTAKSEISLIENGQMIKPIRALLNSKVKVPGIIIKKVIGGREMPLEIFKFEGGITKGKKLSAINRNELSSNQKKALEEIETLYFEPKGRTKIKLPNTDIELLIERTKKQPLLKRIFPKETTLDLGEVVITRIGKLTKKGKFVLDKSAKRRTIGEIMAVQESKVTLTDESIKLGLRETELLKEIIAVRDISLPKLTKGKKIGVIPEETKTIDKISVLISEPKDIRKFTERTAKDFDIIKGNVIRKEFVIPEKTERMASKRGVKPNRTPEQKLELERQLSQLLKQRVGAIGLKVAKMSKVKSKTLPQIKSQLGIQEQFSQYPKIVQAGGTAIGGFIGLNLYERTEATIQRPLSLIKESGKLSLLKNERTISIQRFSLLNKGLAKEITKDISKEITKDLSKQIQKELQKNLQKELSKEIIKTPIKEFPTIRKPPRFPSPLIIPIVRFKSKSINLGKLLSRRKRDDFAIVESFTARELRLPPMRIKQRDIGKVLARQQNIAAIRLRPIIIPNIVSRRRRNG